MRLGKQEQETIIVFNEQDRLATIFTYNKTWQKHLEKNLGLKPTMNNRHGGKEYETEKKQIKMPRKKREDSPETKKKRADQLRKARQSRNKG
jgi:hypothetical protein